MKDQEETPLGLKQEVDEGENQDTGGGGQQEEEENVTEWDIPVEADEGDLLPPAFPENL